MQLRETSKYFTHPGWRLKKSRNLRRFIFTIWKKIALILYSEVVYSLWTWSEFKKKKKNKNENTKTWLDSPEN